jgi:hypothetical protein
MEAQSGVSGPDPARLSRLVRVRLGLVRTGGWDMTGNEQHRGLMDAVRQLWEHQLACDPVAAVAHWDDLVAEHGAQAVGASLAAVRKARRPADFRAMS